MSNYNISWCNESWLSYLNEETALDYFCQPSNPFYENTCNNETIRMQRLDMIMLNDMTGIEYVLAYYYDHNLFLIRKQYRQSLEETKSLCLYYVISGMIYQCPDVGTWLNSRIKAISDGFLHTLQLASKEVQYTTNTGLAWIKTDISSPSKISTRPFNKHFNVLDHSVSEFLLKEENQ